MKAAVVVFPGSNCDHDVLHVLRDVLRVDTATVWHRDRLSGVDLVVLPGGFSFGDYLRCGAIAHLSPVMTDVKRHSERGGLVLGICNGFQTLCEARMLPGALTRNAHRRFECRDVHLLKVAEDAPFVRGVPSVIRVPIAHGDGRYQLDDEGRKRLEGEGRIAFRYCDAAGVVGPEANPNGSIDAIAGVYGGPKRNVLGLMPHPERLAESILGGDDGRKVFEAILS